MRLLIEISEESYNKLTQKSMLMSASAIDEAVDAIKKGRVLPKEKSDSALLLVLWSKDGRR